MAMMRWGRWTFEKMWGRRGIWDESRQVNIWEDQPVCQDLAPTANSRLAQGLVIVPLQHLAIAEEDQLRGRHLRKELELSGGRDAITWNLAPIFPFSWPTEVSGRQENVSFPVLKHCHRFCWGFLFSPDSNLTCSLYALVMELPMATERGVKFMASLSKSTSEEAYSTHITFLQVVLI